MLCPGHCILLGPGEEGVYGSAAISPATSLNPVS